MSKETLKQELLDFLKESENEEELRLDKIADRLKSEEA